MLWPCYQMVLARPFIRENTGEPNQTSLMVVIVLRRTISKDQIRSNDCLWVVAFEDKGNLLKDMTSNKNRVIFFAEQALFSDFIFNDRRVVHSKQEFVLDCCG